MPIHDWTRVNSGIFHHFHQQWIGSLCNALNAGRLPKGFYGLIEQSAGGPIPDVLTLQVGPECTGESNDPGGIAVANAPPKTRFVRQVEMEAYARKANRIAVYHPLGDVVAVIEIVSPGNKDKVAAIRSFVKKAVDFLDHGVHLLIIDLFPPTKRDPQGVHKAIWDEIHDEPFDLPADKPLTLASYSGGLVKTAYVEPVAVGDALPDMPLFLKSDVYIPAPLETTYQSTWDICPGPMKEAVIGDVS